MLSKIPLFTREQNALLDSLLMGKYGFLSETLMELAGVAVAQATHVILNQQSHKKIAVLVGPGNNGGDGLVAARLLKLMGHEVTIYLFKKGFSDSKNTNFLNLCTHNQIPQYQVEEKFRKTYGDDKEFGDCFGNEMSQQDLVIDAIFGFPFQGEFREPYGTLIKRMVDFQDKIFSVDIPSGWDANQGNIKGLFTPKYLISLGLPKIGAVNGFKGRNFMGGRFIPVALEKQMGIKAPEYPGSTLFFQF